MKHTGNICHSDNDLRALYEFQLILVDLQGRILQAIEAGVHSEKIENNLMIYDKLETIYKQYDRFYFARVEMGNRLLMKERENMGLYDTINKQQVEIEQLKKELEFAK